jgi:site-specific recombinase XerD
MMAKAAASTSRRPKAVKTYRRRPPTLATAIRAFNEDRDLSSNTRTNYATVHAKLIEHYGEQAHLAAIKPSGLRSVFDKQWGTCAPATWNARVAAMQSLCRFWCRLGWMSREPTSALQRRRVCRDDTKAIPYEELCKLWLREDVHLREKLFWRCLYSTAARAREILSVNVENLDLPRKRAVIVGKGGHQEYIVWGAATARLMRRYIANRDRGPVFVTYGVPNMVPADADRAPDGRARLSYQRAWQLFHQASGGKWTLHQLRHSALTHLGEQGVSAPLLMAKSRHRDPRTLARYVHPGVEAVARLTAEYDPDRRFPRRG